MNIKKFFERCGKDTTTNFELMDMVKKLKIPNFHIKMKDEVKLLKRIKKRTLYCIISYHLSNQDGVHWCAMYLNKDKSYCFDSYGIQPLKEVKDFLKHGVYSTFQIQQTNQKFCRQLSL